MAWNSEPMDNAAAEAANELVKLDKAALVKVATWWKKWYLKAGHKRLGRLLLRYASDDFTKIFE